MKLSSQYIPSIRWLLTGSLLVLSASLLSPVHAKPGGRPGTPGVYRLQVRGTWSGEIQVRITAAELQILNGKVTDESGKQIKLKLKDLPLDNGRFSSTDTVDGRNAQISGRVDAAEGGVVVTSRVIMHIRFDDGSHVRLYGQRESN